jgi:hypothetical protein
MSICLKIDEKNAMELISARDDLTKQIIRAWCRSNISHCFEGEDRISKAVKKNQKTLKSPETIETLFTPSNYLFSTATGHRQETLYFRDPATKRTGRLRQQHRKGPLARIDKKARKHLFLSKKRFYELPEEKPKRLPKFYPYEQQAEDYKYHIEFACDGHKTSHWHRSEGTVRTSRQDLDHRVGLALKGILGIRGKFKK